MSKTPIDPPSSSSPTATSGTHEPESSYESLCGICFAEVHPRLNPRGKLNSCDHLFCAHCIKIWAQNTNVCPSCKARFTRIYTANPDTAAEEETKVRKKNYHAWEDSYYSDSEDDGGEENPYGQSDDGSSDDGNGVGQRARDPQRSSGQLVRCDVCRESTNAARIIFCDRRECGHAAHLDCAGLTERPLTYLCQSCTSLRDGVPPPPPEARDPALLSHSGSRAPVPSHTPAAAPAPKVPARLRAVQPTATCPTARRPAPAVANSARAVLYPPLPVQAPAAPTPTLPNRMPTAARAVVQSPTATSAATRAINLSRPNMHLTEEGPVPRRGRTGRDEDDDLYFLVPSKHARSAATELGKLNQARSSVAETRRNREEAKRRRMEETAAFYLPSRSSGGGGASWAPHHSHSQHTTAGHSPELQQRMLRLAEGELVDPRLRAATVERIAAEWAADMVPVLRRREAEETSRLRLDADGVAVRAAPLSTAQVEARERRLHEAAMRQARPMAQRQLDAQTSDIRARREMLVRAQAQREAAALAKLARFIAATRNMSAP